MLTLDANQQTDGQSRRESVQQGLGFEIQHRRFPDNLTTDSHPDDHTMPLSAMNHAKRVLPDYQGGSLLNLTSSLVAARGGTAPHPLLRDLDSERIGRCRNIVLLLLDGLGHEFLRNHGADSILASHARGHMTSVFPSTTTTAITTLLTGLSPREHALTGWFSYWKSLDDVIAVLPFQRRRGRKSLSQDIADPAAFYDHPTLFDRLETESHIVIPANLAYSPYNASHSGTATIHPFAGYPELFKHLARLLREPEQKYIYAYWPGIDHLAHEHGTSSAKVKSHFHAVDRACADLIAAAKGSDTTLIVTGDHGLIDVSPQNHTDLGRLPELQKHLAQPLCGERRVAYCHLREAGSDAFVSAAGDILGERFLPRSSRELVEEGWFGPGVSHPELLSRIGDVTLLAQDDASIKDWLPGERRYWHIGSHGGTSSEEMYIPLIVADL